MNVKITEKVIYLIKQYIGSDIVAEQIGVTDDLKHYGLNSLNFIRLIVAIEEEYNIEFDEMLDLRSLRTVCSITEYIENHIN